MKRDQWGKPGSIAIERQEPREGPCPIYIVWKPHTARVFTDKKEVIKFAAWPKSTPTGLAMREWLNSFTDVAVEKPELDTARIKAEGFGPEAHDEDPTSNTKMVT